MVAGVLDEGLAAVLAGSCDRAELGEAGAPGNGCTLVDPPARTDGSPDAGLTVAGADDDPVAGRAAALLIADAAEGSRAGDSAWPRDAEKGADNAEEGVITGDEGAKSGAEAEKGARAGDGGVKAGAALAASTPLDGVERVLVRSFPRG